MAAPTPVQVEHFRQDGRSLASSDAQHRALFLAYVAKHRARRYDS